MSAVLDVGPAHGSLSLISSGGFVYTPTASYSGTDSFTYVAGDGTSQSPSTEVLITVGGTAPPVSSTVPPATTLAPSTTLPAGGSAIATTFANSCSGCHGSAGQGGIGPALAGTTLARGVFVNTTTVGAGAMPGFSTSLSTADIDQLYDYVLALGNGGAIPPPTPVGAEALFVSACGSCHGVDGAGTAFGPSVIGESVGETMSVVRSGDGPMPAFGAGAISDEALAELAAYVESLGGTSSSHGDGTGETQEAGDDDQGSGHDSDHPDSDGDDDDSDADGGSTAVVVRDDDDSDLPSDDDDD